jgi:hypothetical protein
MGLQVETAAENLVPHEVPPVLCADSQQETMKEGLRPPPPPPSSVAGNEGEAKDDEEIPSSQKGPRIISQRRDHHHQQQQQQQQIQYHHHQHREETQDEAMIIDVPNTQQSMHLSQMSNLTQILDSLQIKQEQTNEASRMPNAVDVPRERQANNAAACGKPVVVRHEQEKQHSEEPHRSSRRSGKSSGDKIDDMDDEDVIQCPCEVNEVQ